MERPASATGQPPSVQPTTTTTAAQPTSASASSAAVSVQPQSQSQPQSQQQPVVLHLPYPLLPLNSLSAYSTAQLTLNLRDVVHHIQSLCDQQSGGGGLSESARAWLGWMEYMDQQVNGAHFVTVIIGHFCR